MHSKKVHSFFVSLFVLSLLFYFFVTLFAALQLRPMYMEGIHWFTHVLDKQSPFLDINYSRYSDFIPQAPAVFLIQNFPNIGLKILAFIFSAAYAFIGLFLLLISLAFLFFKKKFHYLPLLTIAFMLSNQISIPSVLVMVPVTLAFYWVAYFLFLLPSKKTWRDFFLTSFFLLLVFWGHESSILLFILMFLGALYRIKIKQFVLFYKLNAVMLLLLISGHIYRVIGSFAVPTQFWNDLEIYNNPYLIFLLSAAAFVLLILSFSLFYERYAFWLYCFLFGVLSLVFALFEYLFPLDGGEILLVGHQARAFVILVAAAFSILFFYIEISGRFLKKVNKLSSLSLLFSLAAFVVFMMARYDLLATKSWSEALNSVQNNVHLKENGCYLLRGEQEDPILGLSGFFPQFTPIYALLWQRARTIEKIVFLESFHGKDACNRLTSENKIFLHEEINFYFQLNLNGFFKGIDFTK